jgi:Uncharacterised protein family (UPF0158)
LLDPEQVDLADLALALEDHSRDHKWWFDPRSGAVEPRFEARFGDDDAATGLVSIDPMPTGVGYADMEDFVARVRDPRAHHLLERAITGRGAFRRFKDALLDYPELRRAWFAFHDVRGERRAIEWLLERGLVDPDAAETALERRPEPEPGEVPGLLDAHGVTHRVVGELRRLYGQRLQSVMLVGAWARGDAHPESPIELLVILERIADRWQEKRRMGRIVWRHSIRHDTVVTVLPVTEAELERSLTPLLARATAEGILVK